MYEDAFFRRFMCLYANQKLHDYKKKDRKAIGRRPCTFPVFPLFSCILPVESHYFSAAFDITIPVIPIRINAGRQLITITANPNSPLKWVINIRLSGSVTLS